MKSKLLYEGPFLKIKFEPINSLFVQSWKSTPASNNAFKSELLAFVAYYKKYKPTKALWLHQKFELDIDDTTKSWIEHRVNIPCIKYGNRMLAFVICNNLLIHLNVIETFEGTKSVIAPKHFATESEARSWLSQDEMTSEKIVRDSGGEVEIMLKQIDENGNCIINIKRPANTITDTIKSLKNLVRKQSCDKEKQQLFNSLTKREREILFLYAQGIKHQAISEQLYISLYTVRTHWRNIKRKLQIISFKDIIKYAEAFQS